LYFFKQFSSYDGKRGPLKELRQSVGSALIMTSGVIYVDCVSARFLCLYEVIILVNKQSNSDYFLPGCAS